jgi:hypothetical protein
MKKSRNEYLRKWNKENKLRRRSHLLKWYYKNRKVFNMMRSRPTGIETDLADEWIQKHYA